MVIIKSLIKELKSRKMQFNVEHLDAILKTVQYQNPHEKNRHGY